MEKKQMVCKACGNQDVNSKMKQCPQCGAKLEQPIYKKPWFWVLIIVVVVAISAISSGNSNSTSTPGDGGSSPSSENNDNITMGEKMALASAKNYLRTMGFSKKGLINQLEFEGYTTEEATYAANNCGANWKEEAVRVAKNYLKTMSFSKQGLIDQLEFEGFTSEEAAYGVENAYK